jgi:hypothetical protein
LDEKDSSSSIVSSSVNKPPTAVINAPSNAYFGQIIEFDASDSYDPDGEIVSYDWNFMDGGTAEGVKTEHVFEFENDFTLEYPLIYTVSLSVLDNSNSMRATSHQIKIYPREYRFYFDSKGLETQKPAGGHDSLKTTLDKVKSNSENELTYELPHSIDISPCTWNVTIYIKKPLLTFVDDILVRLLNNDDEVISEAEKNCKSFGLWTEKKIVIKNEITKKVDFRSLKIIVYGISLRDTIKILYGDEKASQICFNFQI